ncbi:ABC transporter ATP-binding protein [Agromyces sp. NPDC049794]|uniref:ABC transporter ATP-binding protein n=1 Tax=unclassified Agromyces TaxID=2639701 RepID=UPI0033FF55ED
MSNGELASEHSAPAAKVVEARGLRMRYGSRVVLDGIDLDVHRGEVVALLGPNGAGKTTTIEIIEGFRARTGGMVTVLGEDPMHADEAWRARIGVVLQSWRDHGRWPIGELLRQFRSLYLPFVVAGPPGPYDVEELLDMVGLAGQGNARVRSLSGGQRRRLDVAIGLVGRPELLVLDEPTTGFDPVARHEFHELIHRLTDFDHTTILLTTHDLAEAEKVADRILILDGGRIVANGSAVELAATVAGASEITWRENGTLHVHSAGEPEQFVRDLLRRPDVEVTDLRVRSQTLEETYLAMVARREAEAAGSASAQSATSARTSAKEAS